MDLASVQLSTKFFTDFFFSNGANLKLILYFLFPRGPHANSYFSTSAVWHCVVGERNSARKQNLIGFPLVLVAMDLSLTLRFRPSDLSLFPRKPISPINLPTKQYQPIFPCPKTNTKTNAKPHPHLVVTAKQKSAIEGVSKELNAIASQNLDFAPARRRVRKAFVEVQQKLDHCLFKVGFFFFFSKFWSLVLLDFYVISVTDFFLGFSCEWKLILIGG